MASIRLGDLLVKARVITETQLNAALAEQQKWGGRLGETLVRMQILSEEMLVKALSKQLAVPSVDVEILQDVPAHVRAKVPAERARELCALPLGFRDEGRTLVIAMAEPQNLRHLDALRSLTGCRIVPQLAGRQAIERTLRRFYQGAVDPQALAAMDEPLGSSRPLQATNLYGQLPAPPGLSQSPAGQLGLPPDPYEVLPAPPAPIRASPSQVMPQWTGGRAPPMPAGVPSPPAMPLAAAQAPAAPSGRSALEQLAALEEAQRREVAAIKALVALLIDRGVFTREEYLAKVKR